MTACAPDSSYRWLRALRSGILPPGVDDQDDDQLPELAYETFFGFHAEEARTATRHYAASLRAALAEPASESGWRDYWAARQRFVATLPFVSDHEASSAFRVPSDSERGRLTRGQDALRRYEAALEALLVRRRYLASDTPIG